MMNLLLKIKEILFAILFAFGVAFGLFQAGRNSEKKDNNLENEKNANENLRENLEIQKNKIRDVQIADDYLDGLRNKRGGIAKK